MRGLNLRDQEASWTFKVCPSRGEPGSRTRTRWTDDVPQLAWERLWVSLEEECPSEAAPPVTQTQLEDGWMERRM